MVEVGQTAPDFTLLANGGKEITLSHAKGKYIVLYFYPKDMTPGCTTEACDFRDQVSAFAEVGAVVFGVSPDSVNKHDRFVEKYSLPFPLLADENIEVAKKYGVWQQKKTFGKEYMGIVRTTFVIDPNLQVIKVWENVKVKNHVDEVLAFIADHRQSQS
ncbi:thioredoxin-dependent thiol peroxidase [Shouchella lonarensis]|uniref:thioredoxin-dependent peroxiredoxin n=1 Tax=Shouchella lonarensis TaxID=1464122 RepID=A0A1G6GQB8_9BACI|nr:thioredoxin-dependent thiol peroxidase [Shouchella lonarensis]SDB84023.1 peroxiredoxin Q/BCP [Shouchella lonarensis]